ncbi:ABC transporter permease [Saccharomonospora xinjiangensis]|uniref:ABC transporter permease n=1 Tax=Saccharomonospora xinjiangensis TaxID=75294 RepID=UPI00350F8FDA
MSAWRRSPSRPLPRLPWTTAPRAALSSPLTLVAAVITTLLSCFLAMGAVLHASASGGSTLDYQAATVCPDSYGPVISKPRVDPAQVRPITETVERHAAAHGFGTPTVSLFSKLVPDVGFGDGKSGETFTVRLAYRDGGTGHLALEQGSAAPGFWAGRNLTGYAALEPGDRATGAGTGRFQVTGVYTDLYNPAPRWWCSVQDLAVQNRLVDHIATGSVLFATDRASFDEATRDHAALERLTITFPTPPPATLAEAEDTLRRAQALLADVRQDLSDKGLGDALLSVPFARSTELAQQAQGTVAWSILPLAALSVGVGLAGTATVGLQWYQRRRAQVRLHSARGHGSLAVGLLAAAELGLAVTAGGVAGALLARLTLPLYAPPGRFGAGTELAGAAAAAGVLLVSLVVLVAVVAVRTHREFALGLTAPRRRKRLLAFLPWELLTAGVALLGWSRLPRYGDVAASDPVPETHPLALIYPVAVVLTVGIVTARLAWWALVSSHRLRWWSRPAVQWAVRRLAHGRAPVTGVLVVAVLAVGTLAVGSSIAAGQQTALATKSGIFVGAQSRTDVENAVGRGETALPEQVRSTSTVVGTFDAGEAGTILVIDPETFAEAAYVEHLPREELDGLLDRLGTTSDGAVAAIRVGAAAETATTSLGEVRAAGAIDVAPMLGAKPGYLVSRTALDPERIDQVPQWAVLSTLPLDVVGAALREEAVVHMNAVDRDTALDALPFYVVEWTFSFVTLLGVVLGAAAALSLLIAVEVRRRQNTLSGALALRMGLRPRSLWASHLTELGAVALTAVSVGLVCGLTVAAVSVPRFDPARWLPPSSELPALTPLVATVAGCGAAVVAVACWIAVRSVRTAHIAELLRD